MTTIPQPTGDYATEMVSGLWPEINEDELQARGEVFTQASSELGQVIQNWAREHHMIFHDNIWSGSAATAAEKVLEQRLNEMQEMRDKLDSVAKWYQSAAKAVHDTKSKMSDVVQKHQNTIRGFSDNAADLDTKIQNEITAAWNENSEIASDEGSQLGLKLQMPAPPKPSAGKPGGGTPPADTQGQPPVQTFATNNGPAGATQPGDPSQQPPAQTFATNNGPAGGNGPAPAPSPGRSTVPPVASAPSFSPSAASPGSTPASASGAPSMGMTSTASGAPTAPTGAQSGAPQNLLGDDRRAADSGSPQNQDAAAKASAGGPANTGLPPALATPAVLPAAAGAGADAATAAAAAASGAPPAPSAPVEHTGAVSGTRAVGGGGHGGGDGGGGGSGGLGGLAGGLGGLAGGLASGGGSSSGTAPLGPPPTPHQAAPVGSGGGHRGGPIGPGTPGTPVQGPGGPGVHPASTSNTGGDAAAPAPVPVSATRLERDAILAATTADAVRRKHGGHDPMALAHRIAAALNAPDMTTQILTASTFFWMTALTADGEIVVANNYGLGFIPDRVNLPEPVYMATADQTIPAAERARWATYPVAALLGWAAHHGTVLRAVFATADQFSGIDPGAPKKVIEPADIPASGKMQGRSRLQVVAPSLASQLATVGDLNLVDMVPPAPVNADPPDDQSAKLWFEAFKPLTWSSTDREQLHMARFVEYVAHVRDLTLYQAHHAVHAEAQRTAVADWLYWNHIAGLVIDALAESAPVS